MDQRELKKLYYSVSKPSRYTGGEYNLPDVTKPCDVRMCICFPDVYEIAMSNLGIRILYHMLNDRADTVCERCFCPWVDLMDKLEEKRLPLTSIETGRELSDFDFVGFSIQYEMAYTNILKMLSLAGFPLYARDRGEEYPIVLAGGPCMANPEPFAEFFDLMMAGDGEDSLNALVDLIKESKVNGLKKPDIIRRAMEIEGVIAPAYDMPVYGADGKVTGFTRTVKKAVVRDFENSYYPERMLIANTEAVHDRAVLELYRGCTNGCRFCQAGFWYRPIRKRSVDKLIGQANRTIDATGFNELNMSSLSTGDYPDLKGLMDGLKPMSDVKHVRIAMPSVRADSFEEAYATESRKNSITFAPEAGTQRLRDVINKNISDEDILKTVDVATKLGFNSVKLYFILGLPMERDEDVEGIVETVRMIKSRAPRLRVTVSTSLFIPKPFTPFQWDRQISREEYLAKVEHLRSTFRSMRGVDYNWHDSEQSVIEAVFARGDRRLSRVLVRMFQLGARYDGWTEHFDFSRWEEAFRLEGLRIEDYVRELETGELLPYEYIDIGVTRRYMIRERELASSGVTTPNCKDKCAGCGAKVYGGCGL